MRWRKFNGESIHLPIKDAVEEAIKKESHIAYVREFDSALAAVRHGTAQVSFLLNSTRLDQMRDLAYAGKVMPQNSCHWFAPSMRPASCSVGGMVCRPAR